MCITHTSYVHTGFLQIISTSQAYRSIPFVSKGLNSPKANIQPVQQVSFAGPVRFQPVA